MSNTAKDDSTNPRTSRILSLDGGDTTGAFSASVLETFEHMTGKKIVDHFDLITGTSTGGIIAIGLAMGAPAAELRRFFQIEWPKIFPRRGGIQSWLGRVRETFRPKLSSERLRAAIQKVVGNRKLRDARTRLVIPAYDLKKN